VWKPLYFPFILIFYIQIRLIQFPPEIFSRWKKTSKTYGKRQECDEEDLNDDKSRFLKYLIQHIIKIYSLLNVPVWIRIKIRRIFSKYQKVRNTTASILRATCGYFPPLLCFNKRAGILWFWYVEFITKHFWCFIAQPMHLTSHSQAQSYYHGFSSTGRQLTKILIIYVKKYATMHHMTINC
jgi:hypothetical protein